MLFVELDAELGEEAGGDISLEVGGSGWPNVHSAASTVSVFLLSQYCLCCLCVSADTVKPSTIWVGHLFQLVSLCLAGLRLKMEAGCQTCITTPRHSVTAFPCAWACRFLRQGLSAHCDCPRT